jgi:hypothetical protein
MLLFLLWCLWLAAGDDVLTDDDLLLVVPVWWWPSDAMAMIGEVEWDVAGDRVWRCGWKHTA